MTIDPLLRFGFSGLALLLLAACATRQDCMTPVGGSDLTPAKVASLGRGEGTVVTWGGVIASTRNLAEDTEVEAVAYRLDRCGRPLTGGVPVGRFIARHPGFLEPSDYRAGRRVTATGRISAVREGRVDEARYAFPVLDRALLRLWPDEADTGAGWTPYARPWISIGIGSGGHGVGGGIGVSF
ncbi:MAG: Slp family lipoprotein [Thiocapsa sp.]|nr:Slp family lipoprotein [Thiocapsa sp.]MCG6897011.1 Slp family lipoprotein [Thiocapsa sp.]MCG6983816.1 Slp family lipoprotein [Thiocapsa sp.]